MESAIACSARTYAQAAAAGWRRSHQRPGPSPAILYLAGGRGRLDRALARSLSLVTLHVHACNTRSVGIKKQTAARPPTRAMGQGRRPGTPSARPSRNDRQRILMPHMQSDKRLPLWLIVRWLCRCNQTACLTPRSGVAGSPVGNTLTCGGCRQATEAGRTEHACTMHSRPHARSLSLFR